MIILNSIDFVFILNSIPVLIALKTSVCDGVECYFGGGCIECYFCGCTGKNPREQGSATLKYLGSQEDRTYLLRNRMSGLHI